MFYRSSVSRKPLQRISVSGFSIVELIVSISILVLVLSIVLTKQSSFNSAILLRSQAYEVALTLREVQLGAVSATGDGSGGFRSIQGVYFSTAEPDRFRVFTDANSPPNYFYDTGEDVGFSGSLDSRFEICAITSDASESELSIVFERPNFDAHFYNDTSGSAVDTQTVTISVGLVGGSCSVCGSDVRDVEVTSSGQVAVLECS